MHTIREAEVEGKKVLVRVDFNVPMDKDGAIIDDSKIRAALPTIEYLLDRKARVVLMSHLGRPKGKPEEQYSLKPVARRLAEITGRIVHMGSGCGDAKSRAEVADMNPKDLYLLENVRFCPGEEVNSPDFARELAAYGDIFINDAFGCAHRAHASTAGIAAFLPAYAGILMENEVNMLRTALEHRESPRMAILGGAKVADKIGLIRNLLDRMDIILIGGGMANSFLKAQGFQIGRSICEEDLVDDARNIINEAKSRQVEFILPVDAVAASEVSGQAETVVVNINSIPSDYLIADIGPETIESFKKAIMKSKTIIWNGPLGIYEYEQFSHGTVAIAWAVAESQAVSIIGGGDSAAAVQELGLEGRITHISTGGGATLELLEGLPLPGVVSCEW